MGFIRLKRPNMTSRKWAHGLLLSGQVAGHKQVTSITSKAISPVLVFTTSDEPISRLVLRVGSSVGFLSQGPLKPGITSGNLGKDWGSYKNP